VILDAFNLLPLGEVVCSSVLPHPGSQPCEFPSFFLDLTLLGQTWGWGANRDTGCTAACSHSRRHCCVLLFLSSLSQPEPTPSSQPAPLSSLQLTKCLVEVPVVTGKELISFFFFQQELDLPYCPHSRV
jgi:hypothetical protein